jgi:hypothetical protein
MPFCDSFVATAKGTQALAIGQMYVKANPFGTIGFSKTFLNGFFPFFT